MGLVRQHIRIYNAARPDVEEVDANALVDSGALDLCVSPLVAKQLKLTKLDERTITVADGRRISVDYVGPVAVEVFGRRAYTGAMVIGEDVLLGAIPMESLDVMIDAQRQQLIPNPENPDRPGALVMTHWIEHRD